MLYYPVIHLQNAKIMRSIAVAVWEKENGEILYRSQYEQILEKSGFIRKVDIFAFEQLCRDYAKIRQAAGGESVVGIRLSRLAHWEKMPCRVLRGITQKYGVPEEALELLVDECFLGGRSTELLRKSINELKEAGFSLGLMNFGEDFSSFRFLENLPVTTVFFDSEYVMNEKEEERKNILYTLFHLTRNMRLFSVGQGVRNRRGCNVSFEKRLRRGNRSFVWRTPLFRGIYGISFRDRRAGKYVPLRFSARLCNNAGGVSRQTGWRRRGTDPRDIGCTGRCAFRRRPGKYKSAGISGRTPYEWQLQHCNVGAAEGSAGLDQCFLCMCWFMMPSAI